VSDVVATILLLALTVTLFASIFAFVTSFPSPPAQNSNQFQASLVIASNQSYITTIKILHLAGPSVSKLGLVYLKSANHPSDPEFQNAIPVAWGINNASTWNLGVTWTWNFPVSTLPHAKDNITIYVVYSSQLLYSVVLPGQFLSTPPTIVATWTVAASPIIGSGFTVYATISGNLGSDKAYINLGGVPGQSGNTVAMLYNNSLSLWQFTVNAGNTSGTPAGSYFGIINVTGAYGQTAVASVPVNIVTNPTGAPPLSVAVAMSSAPPMMGGGVGGGVSLIAFVTYNGAAQKAPLNVSFFANETSPTPVAFFAGFGPKALTISGPGTQTAVSTTRWVIPAKPDSPAVYTLVASATVGGTLSAQGNLTFSVPLGIGASFSATPKTTASVTLNGKLYLNSTAYGPGPFQYENTGTAAVSMYINYTVGNTSNAKTFTMTTANTIAAGATATFASPTTWKAPTKTTYSLTIVVYVANVGLVIQTSTFVVSA